MTFWRIREELSLTNRLRRSYYELLRDDLDQFMLSYGLIDSYKNFQSKKIQYPFVEKREMKPRTRVPHIEHEPQNSFLVIFLEDCIPAADKKYIRFLDVNKTTKVNLLRYTPLSLAADYNRSHKYLEAAQFYDFLRVLLPIDYALLIQRDPASWAQNRYNISHFHVRIDWPIAEAAEELARDLRYISKDIYEKGEKYAEDIQKKFFEYFGLPEIVGGRRTAAIVASQYLKRIPCVATIYVGSSESRSMMRISERSVSKAILMKFSGMEIDQIARDNSLLPETFRQNYVVAREREKDICIFQATYSWTEHARPPYDGKLRELKPDVYWQTVWFQQLLPKPGVQKYPPLPINVIYS
ncbi:MAG: hypothetical protein Q8P24_04030 [Desulfobacterales bacterium]|nr:hypothetical protein [Desulfobacterales bacterium]